MLTRRIVRWAATGIFVLCIVPVVGDFISEWARENGFYDRPSERVWSVVAFAQSIFGSQGFFWLLFASGGFAVGSWFDTWLARKERGSGIARPWWYRLHSFTIRGFSCLVAGIEEKDFENSQRAKAVASEIRGYVNSGHIPLMLEEKPSHALNIRLQDRPSAPYPAKNVDNDAIILKSDLERLAISRQWDLPWEPQERKEPVRLPASKAEIQRLLNTGSRTQP